MTHNLFFIIPFIIFPILLIIVIINFVVNPIQVNKAKIIKKIPGGIGQYWKIQVEINGEIMELRTEYYIYNSVSEGEVVTLWYNHDYCAHFSKNV